MIMATTTTPLAWNPPPHLRFVNVRFNLRFVMVSVSDPIPEDVSEEMPEVAEEDPEMTTLSFALSDVDIM